MEKHKTCSFFGHRKIEISEELKIKLNKTIEDLIINHNVTSFLFGSRSEFNSLCQLLVTEFKQKYPHIERVTYTCQSEKCILENEKEVWENIFSNLKKQKIELVCSDKEVEHNTKYSAGKASYVERNQAMINDSDYCIFYYNENYKPKPNKKPASTEPKSGTGIAYKYAKQKNKTIINVFTSL